VELKHILFPVDFSEQCTAAANEIEALARGTGARLTLMHVLECPPTWYSDVEAARLMAMIDIKRIKQHREEQLQRYLERELNHLQPLRLVSQGDAATEVVEFATREAVSLITMPTRGAGIFRRLLLGSCTARVLHDTSCPVWTTAHSEHVTRSRFPYRTIACAVDVTDPCAETLEWASSFAALQSTELRVVYAIDVDEESADSAVMMTRRHRRALACELWEDLKRDHRLKGTLAITYGSLGAAVRRAVHDLEADILIIGRGRARGHLGRLHNNAYSIIRESPCTVISIPS
jgi:nucleotide-binding universal stress UspA family protein